MEGFSKIAAPLSEMLKKGNPSELNSLTDKQYESFETVKEKLLNRPILALPKPGEFPLLNTNASDRKDDALSFRNKSLRKTIDPSVTEAGNRTVPGGATASITNTLPLFGQC